jgi:hypothetical protein
MANYVQQQSVGEILRNTFAIYGKGFVVIFLSYFLPLLPFNIYQGEAMAAHAMGRYWLIYLCSFPVTLPATAVVTVSVSDICLGNAPSLVRSYKRIFAVILKLLATNILQLAIILIGLILVFVPSIIAMLWLLFTPSVVILEGLWGFAALKRSKQLARGYNWRNLGVVLLLMIIGVVIFGILHWLYGLLFPATMERFAYRFFSAVTQSLSPPLTLTAIVLLYYDLRARKEAYDNSALAEDLRR